MTQNGTTVRLPKPSGQVDLEPAPVFDISKLSDERTQALARLLKEGHFSVAPLRNPKLILHSHLPHLLGSAYALGASIKQLEACYEQETSTLLKVEEGFIRGDRVSKENWRSFLNDKSYTVAYVDFFDREVKERDGDWRSVVEDYLYATSAPIINGLAGGLGHPFIHLAYAYEFQCGTVATEALSLGCTERLELHSLLDNELPQESTYKTKSFAEVMERVRADTRFGGLFTIPGITNIGTLLQHQFQAVMEHWNAWEVDDPTERLEEIVDLSVLLAISGGDADKSFDFFNVHLMTVAHALRVLWQHFPPERRKSILRQYALFAILIYIAQLRPTWGIEGIESVDIKGRDWDWVVQTALAHDWVLDAHFFKVVRAPKAFAETYGQKNDFYLKAALKFLAEFRGWEGFGAGVEGFDPSKDGYRPG